MAERLRVENLDAARHRHFRIVGCGANKLGLDHRAAVEMRKQLRIALPPRNPLADRLVIFRSEEHTSELQSIMRISYAVFCLKKKNTNYRNTTYRNNTKLNLPTDNAK